MNKKITVYAGIAVIVIIGGYFIFRSPASPDQAIKGIQQVLTDKDTVTADKFIDSGAIADNVWPRYKGLYQQALGNAGVLMLGQDSNGKDTIKQAFYQAIRGNDNAISGVLHQLVTAKLNYKIDSGVAKAKLDYQADTLAYPLDFVFKKSDDGWKLSDIPGLENVLLIYLSPDSAEIIKQARDSQRLSDLGSIKGAISLYLVTVDHPVICQDKSKIYRSDEGTTAVDGAGWLPVDLTATPGGSPLSVLPKDPVNQGKFIYSYACDPTQVTFEMNVSMESNRYGTRGGKDDIISTDGGNNSDMYEMGTAPGLNLIP